MMTRRSPFRVQATIWVSGALVATLMAFVTAAPAAAIGQTCIDDGPPDRIKTLCIAAPEDGAVVAGEISVTGTVDPVNDPRTQKVEFYLDGDYLLTEFQSSSSSRAIFDFELPTTGWVDGLHRLEMLAITRIDGGPTKLHNRPRRNRPRL